MFGLGSIIKVVATLIIVLTLVLVGRYFMNMQAALAISEENSKKLQQAVETQREAMEGIIKDQQRIREANDQLNDTIRKQTADVNNLRDKFSTSANGESRDIGKTAIAKPDSIQRVINKASSKAIRCMEIASGSPLTKDEQNEKNSECAALTGSN
jgi:DNA-binding protein H-NS